MKRRRVLFLTGSLGMGGTERNILHLASGLSRERFAVEVWSDYGGEALEEELRRRGVFCGSLKEGHSLGKPLLTRLLRHNLPYQWRLFRLLRANREGVVHAFGFPMAYYAVLLGRLAGCDRVIFAVQDWDVWKRGGVYRFLDRLCSRLAWRVVADGEGARRLAIARQGMSRRKVMTIYDGVDVEELRPTKRAGEVRRELGLGEDRPTVGMVARLDVAKKGQDVFLAAARLIAERHPEAQFVMVGDGPDRAEVERLAAGLPERARPALAGFRSDLANVLIALDVLVIPSRWESVPKVLLEAMWLRRAVVATRVGDVEEIMDEGCGVLVRRDDAGEAAEAVCGLLSDPAGRRVLGEAARARIEERGLTLDATVRRYERLYGMG